MAWPSSEETGEQLICNKHHHVNGEGSQTVDA